LASSTAEMPPSLMTLGRLDVRRDGQLPALLCRT
jgi:hypothetical protein